MRHANSSFVVTKAVKQASWGEKCENVWCRREAAYWLILSMIFRWSLAYINTGGGISHRTGDELIIYWTSDTLELVMCALCFTDKATVKPSFSSSWWRDTQPWGRDLCVCPKNSKNQRVKIYIYSVKIQFNMLWKSGNYLRAEPGDMTI